MVRSFRRNGRKHYGTGSSREGKRAGTPVVDGQGPGIAAGSEHRETAARFPEFLNAPDRLRSFRGATGWIPVASGSDDSLIADPSVKDLWTRWGKAANMTNIANLMPGQFYEQAAILTGQNVVSAGMSGAFRFKRVRGNDGPWIGLGNDELVLGQPLFWEPVRQNLQLFLATPVMVALALVLATVAARTDAQGYAGGQRKRRSRPSLRGHLRPACDLRVRSAEWPCQDQGRGRPRPSLDRHRTGWTDRCCRHRCNTTTGFAIPAGLKIVLPSTQAESSLR